MAGHFCTLVMYSSYVWLDCELYFIDNCNSMFAVTIYEEWYGYGVSLGNTVGQTW